MLFTHSVELSSQHLFAKCNYHTPLHFLSLTMSIKQAAKARTALGPTKFKATLDPLLQLPSLSFLLETWLPKWDEQREDKSTEHGEHCWMKASGQPTSPTERGLGFDRHCTSPTSIPGTALTSQSLVILTIYSSPAESWLCFHVQNASARCDCTFPHHLQPAHILPPWNDGIQHSLDQTWQNRVAKWWHSCLQVKIIHWNMLKCWYRCSWHCSVPAGEGGSRCPAKSFGHHKRKRRTGWFSSCHPRCCPSSFLSCLPDTLEITWSVLARNKPSHRLLHTVDICRDGPRAYQNHLWVHPWLQRALEPVEWGIFALVFTSV